MSKKILPAYGLSLIDALNLLFLLVLIVFFMFIHDRLDSPGTLLLLFAVFFFFSVGMVRVRNRPEQYKSRPLLFLLYPIVLFISMYESLTLLIPYFTTNRYDAAMDAFDFSVLGTHPTVWIQSWIRPWLTDLMYLLYVVYFPLPLILIGGLFTKRRFPEIEESLVIYLICYYGAYISYFFLPVEGPRYYPGLSHDVPLDGIFFAEPVRRLINFCEPTRLDCFPSLHAAILLVTLLLCNRFRPRLFHYFLPLSAGIFISLIYCRYHYFADILAGMTWAVISFMLGTYLYNKGRQHFAVHFTAR